MNYISARDPKRTKQGGIMLFVTFEEVGEMEFYATPTDVEEHGREIYARADGGAFGEVVPYVEPVIVPVSITPRQCRLVLSSYGMLADVQNYIDSLAGPEGEEAKITWEYATSIRRDNALLIAIATSKGLSASQIDEMFIKGSTL